MEDVSRSWWLQLIRGVAAVIFGILALIWPMITLLVLVTFFGVYAIISGVSEVVAGFQDRTRSRAWLIISGILGILAGIIALLWPGITSLALLFVIAVWAILAGISEIVHGVQLRKVITNELMYIIGGALSVIFGLALLSWPAAGMLSLVWLIGIFAVLYGIAMIALSIRMKNFTTMAGVP